jgi:hypothetical protein
MGFYYGSGGPPPEEEPETTWRETFIIIGAVFRALALPLGILVGAIAYLVFMFWMFTIHPLLGLATIGVVVLAVVARGIWEATHPPDLDKIDRW